MKYKKPYVNGFVFTRATMGMGLKKILITTWLGLLFTAVCAVFWYTDLQYQLPTPIPDDYVEIAEGTKIDWAEDEFIQGNKPLFLHFFNPECPCSKFNIPHFRSLVSKFSDTVDFAIVVINNKKEVDAKTVLKQLGTPQLPVYFDNDLSRKLGVYSTPQAALVSANQQLYYRGNYNKSRYCTDLKTNYAEIALTSLVNGNPIAPVQEQLAYKSYGCTISYCGRL